MSLLSHGGKGGGAWIDRDSGDVSQALDKAILHSVAVHKHVLNKYRCKSSYPYLAFNSRRVKFHRDWQATGFATGVNSCKCGTSNPHENASVNFLCFLALLWLVGCLLNVSATC